MPATFTHPIAVLPFRRFCPMPLSFAGLIIGSMSPDFGYYFQQFAVATYAHTIAGTFVVCLPSGFVTLAFLYLLRKPVCFMLPQPHRAALTRLAADRPGLTARRVLCAAVSLLLGAWTHTAWDSFTHKTGWAVARLGLDKPLFSVGESDFPAFYVLQQASTVIGGALLLISYLRWLRRTPATHDAASDTWPDRKRYLLLIALAVAALAIAIPFAASMAAKFNGYLAFRVFVFRASVYASAIYAALLLPTAIVVYALKGGTCAKHLGP